MRAADQMDAGPRGRPQANMTAEEALAAAEREGLVLQPSKERKAQVGSAPYNGVTLRKPGSEHPYQALYGKLSTGGRVSLGNYATAEEAALVLARAARERHAAVVVE
eukprot:3408317-Prymnesium_polylepis.1